MKAYPFLLVGLLFACGSEDSALDNTPPTLLTEGTYPQACAVLERGKTHTFLLKMQDNHALGSFNLDIHHNFDQHSHGSSAETCVEDAPKQAIKPFVLILTEKIPEGSTSYTATVPVVIPGDVDPGDYHLRIDVTDKTGWQSQKRMSIKLK